MNKLVTILLILFGLQANLSALEVSVVHNESPIEVEDEVVELETGRLISGVLKSDSDIHFSSGNYLNLKKGSRISFHPPSETDSTDTLKIFGLATLELDSLTTWQFSEDLIIELNCGRSGGVGASFMFFNQAGHLQEGCRLANQTKFTSEAYDVVVNAGSKFKITHEGDLAYAQNLLEGELLLNGDWLKLLPEHSLSFFENETKNPYFFYLATGETLDASTSLGQVTLGQSLEDDQAFATIFHENGLVASGFNVGGDVDFKVAILGHLHKLTLKENTPVRFYEDGSLYQVALSSNLTVKSSVSALVTRQELQFTLTQTLELDSGENFHIPENAQLIFKNNQLTGFTHLDLQGFAFTYTIEEEQLLGSL